MELEPYQLFNLVELRVPFLMIDLRSQRVRKTDSINLQKWVAPAHKVRPSQVMSYLKEQNLEKSHPIILIHQWGWVGKWYTRKLEKDKHTNVEFITSSNISTLQEKP